MKIASTLLAAAAAAFLSCVVYSVVSAELFSIRCSDYISRAATANTIPLAEQNLKLAIGYLETHGMTSGYTSVLYNSPGDDVGFFYTNLKESERAMEAVPADASELTVSNTLLKLHNSLLIQGKDGTSLNAPSGISVFPHNATLLWLAMAAVIVGGFAGLVVAART